MHSAKTTRSRAGEKGRVYGQWFQNSVQGQLEASVREKLASWYEHAQPLFKCIKRGVFIPVRGGKSDFIGMLNGSGISFVCEAKSTESERFARNDIPEAQVGHLEATVSGGGIALLAIQFRSTAPFSSTLEFVIPWQSIPWQCKRTALSISAADLGGWELQKPIFLSRFAEQCGKCLQVRLVRRANGKVWRFCRCGVDEK